MQSETTAKVFPDGGTYWEPCELKRFRSRVSCALCRIPLVQEHNELQSSPPEKRNRLYCITRVIVCNRYNINISGTKYTTIILVEPNKQSALDVNVRTFGVYRNNAINICCSQQRITKSVVTGQTPVTLEWRNTPVY